MKKILAILLLVFVFGCGTTTESNITEVGTPDTNPLSSKAIASALKKSIENSFSALPQAAAENITADTSVNVYAVTSTDGFSCLYDVSTRTETCSCPEGGTLTHSFDSDFSRAGVVISFSGNMNTEYSSCVINTCDTTVTLDGDPSGQITGSYTVLSQVYSITAQNGTSASCSGITGNSADVGFDFTATLSNDNAEFSGSFCINDSPLTFDTLAELQNSVDPDASCTDF